MTKKQDNPSVLSFAGVMLYAIVMMPFLIVGVIWQASFVHMKQFYNAGWHMVYYIPVHWYSGYYDPYAGAMGEKMLGVFLAVAILTVPAAFTGVAIWYAGSGILWFCFWHQWGEAIAMKEFIIPGVLAVVQILFISRRFGNEPKTLERVAGFSASIPAVFAIVIPTAFVVVTWIHVLLAKLLC